MIIYQCFFIILLFHLSFSQQYYDYTLCSTDTDYPGTRYTCSFSQKSCQTFLVYRANNHFPTIQKMSTLFKIDPNRLISINNVSNFNHVLKTGHEVLVPITCSCSGMCSQANFTYTVPENTTFSEISCAIFEGLVKSTTLFEENQNVSLGNNVRAGSNIHVPLKCACPDNFTTKYLITYPLIEGDDTRKLSTKFNVSIEDIWKVNHLEEPSPTVFPTTTVLIPLKNKPLINFKIPDSDPPIPQFLPMKSVEKTNKLSQMKRIYIVGSVVAFILVFALSTAFSLYVKALKKFKAEKILLERRISLYSTPKSSPFSGPSSTNNSCLSPDLLIGIKYSLFNYSNEELKQATKNFSEDNKIGDNVYKGLLDNTEVMIKEMVVDGTKQVIDVYSKINHVNIVKLNGICYGEDDFSCSYLVFEFPLNGSLRDCLADSSSALHWHRRTQIAFDIATGIHYLHYSFISGYTHLNLNSKNICLTSSWRAKITVFGNAPLLKEPGSLAWVAPEHILQGVVSEKVDIFAFGVVLLELISGKEAFDGKLNREAIKFSEGGMNEGGCFDQLRTFVDPCFKEDYPLAEALCLAVLAGSCIEDEPLHRPSMDDVLKILARMV